MLYDSQLYKCTLVDNSLSALL